MTPGTPARPEIAILGGGPAGLAAAETAARGGASVTVYDRMPSLGRKLLMAGRGGLNITHGEPFARFATRYGTALPHLMPALEAFSPDHLRVWAAGLGEETIVGSSGRVFPRSWKASPLLRAWLSRLAGLGVGIRTRHCWTGFGPDGTIRLAGPAGEAIEIRPDAAILALGGASWPRLGSDGRWTAPVSDAGIAVSPLRPANCGLLVPWSERIRVAFAGTPLKRIVLAFGPVQVRGEAVVTERGLEGGAVYAVSGAVRDALDAGSEAILGIDLRPDLDADRLAEALARPRGKRSRSTFLAKTAGLPPVAIAILQEVAGPGAGTSLPTDPARLAALIKAAPLRITGTTGLDRAISTAGGIVWAEVDASLMLSRRPGIFVAGEMLDWEAPTGGYLLQACFATGTAAARGALAFAARQSPINRPEPRAAAPYAP